MIPAAERGFRGPSPSRLTRHAGHLTLQRAASGTTPIARGFRRARKMQQRDGEGGAVTVFAPSRRQISGSGTVRCKEGPIAWPVA
jgi:hypothetical protein